MTCVDVMRTAIVPASTTTHDLSRFVKQLPNLQRSCFLVLALFVFDRYGCLLELNSACQLSRCMGVLLRCIQLRVTVSGLFVYIVT